MLVYNLFSNFTRYLYRGRKAKFFPEDVTNSYRGYTKEEIAKLLSLADLRDRCMILLMASSGIRVGAIPSLRISSLLKLDEGVGFLTVYPGTKHSYVTLVTSEFLTTIEEYLEFRRRQGERVVAESHLYVINSYFWKGHK